MLDARHIPLAGLLAGILLLSGCGGRATQTSPSVTDGPQIIALADNDYRLTEDQFKEALIRTALLPSGGYLTRDILSDFRDSMVADTLTGFAADEEIDLSEYWHDRRTYQSRYDNVLLSSYFEYQVFSQISADSAEVIAFYNDHPERFWAPDQVEVSRLMAAPPNLRYSRDSLHYKSMSTDELFEATRAYADMMLRKLDSGESFKEVAATYSHDSKAIYDSGYAGWLQHGTVLPPFDSVAFSLTPGTYSQPYSDSHNWYIVLVHNRIDAGPLPITDSTVCLTAQQALLTDKFSQIAKSVVDSLSKDATLLVNEPLLDSNLLTLADSLWYALVNDIDTVDVLQMRTAEDGYRTRAGLTTTTREEKLNILEGFKRQYSVVQAARRDRIDTMPRVVALHDKVRHETVKMIMLRQWFDRSWMPSDSMVAEYYARNTKEFLVKKPYKVQHIITSDSLLAIFLRDQARSGVEFMDLAKEYYPGEASIRVELADLGFIGPKDVDSAFFAAAGGLLPGNVSDPVRTRYGWHIIKMIERKDSKSLADARAEIIMKLTEQRRDAEFQQVQKRLFAKYNAAFPFMPDSVFLEPLAYRKK